MKSYMTMARNLFGRALIFILVAVCLSSCAGDAGISSSLHGRAMQTFAFNMLQDNQHVVVLDYRYLADNEILAEKPKYQVDKTDGGIHVGIGGVMPKGTSLYVKWRNLETGEVRDQTVDLRTVLKRNVEQSTIYFMILNSELHVFQIGPRIEGQRDSTIGPAAYHLDDVNQIYPTAK